MIQYIVVCVYSQGNYYTNSITDVIARVDASETPPPPLTASGRTRPIPPMSLGSTSLDMNGSDTVEDVPTPATTFLPSTTSVSLNNQQLQQHQASRSSSSHHVLKVEEHEIKRLSMNEDLHNSSELEDGAHHNHHSCPDNWRKLLRRFREHDDGGTNSRNISLGTRERSWPCGLTNFHFSLCFGLVGFAVFWTGLLLRIYLPHEYFV